MPRDVTVSPDEHRGPMSSDSDDFGLRLGPTYDYVTAGSSQPSVLMRGLTAVGAFVLGFVLVMVVGASRDAARIQDLRRADLINLIAAREERVDSLGERLSALRRELAAVQEVPGEGGRADEDLAQLELQAGLTALEGPGIRVTLADAGDNCASTIPEDCRIIDTDIQLGLNTLFAAGAEAVAVNGERVIATTAVRSAGGTILVNYRPLTSPYHLDAIGDPDALREQLSASTFGRDFALWREQFGLGYEVAAQQLMVPAYRGGLQLQAARTSGSRS